MGPALAAEVVNNCGAEAGQLFKSPETTRRRLTRSANQRFPWCSGRCHANTCGISDFPTASGRWTLPVFALLALRRRRWRKRLRQVVFKSVHQRLIIFKLVARRERRQTTVSDLPGPDPITIRHASSWLRSVYATMRPISKPSTEKPDGQAEPAKGHKHDNERIQGNDK